MDADDQLRQQLVAALGMPFLQGNSVETLRNGVEIFPAMLDAIEAAEESVDFVTFVYWKGEIADRFAAALAAASRRGVAVRVLLDGIGGFSIDRELLDEMKSAGARVEWFRPIGPLTLPWKASRRTHRKVLVCDDAVAFTGGVGIAAEWEGDATSPDSWRETHFRIRGPAVAPLRAAFLEDWLEAIADPEPPRPHRERPPAGNLAVQVIRSTGGLDWSNRATLAFTLIGGATRSIRISTPYFVPSEQTVGTDR